MLGGPGGHDGNVVIVLDRASPMHLDTGSLHHLCRRINLHTSLGNHHRHRSQSLTVTAQDVTHLVGSRLLRSGQGGGLSRADKQTVVGHMLGGSDGHDGDVVIVLDRAGPLHLEAATLANLLRGREFDQGFDHLHRCRTQGATADAMDIAHLVAAQFTWCREGGLLRASGEFAPVRDVLFGIDRNNGDVVVVTVALRPARLETRTTHHLRRGRDRDLRQFGDDGQRQPVSLGRVQLAIGHGAIAQALYTHVFEAGLKFQREYAGIVGFMHHLALGIAHGPVQTLANDRPTFQIGSLQADLARGRHHGFGHRHFDQGIGQFLGIVGGEELPSRGLGHAAQLLARVPGLGAFQAKTDGVHGQVDTEFLQCRHGLAGIGVAGFLTIGNQDNRGLALAELEYLGSLLHGGCHGRHAFGIELHDGAAQSLAIRADRSQHLDVVAVALAIVTVGHQPQTALGRQFIQQIADHFAGDDDLVGAIDLSPHRTGGIEHQDGIGGGSRGCRLRLDQTGRSARQQGHQTAGSTQIGTNGSNHGPALE